MAADGLAADPMTGRGEAAKIVPELKKGIGRTAWGSRRGEGPELPAPAPLGGLAGLGYVASLRTFRAVNDFELDLLAFFERSEAGTLNRREMHEHVVPALAFNESVALRVVEPLHLAGNTHTTCLPYEKRDGTRRAPPVADSADLTGYKRKTATCGLMHDAGPPNANAQL